jgi:hypothetical protein
MIALIPEIVSSTTRRCPAALAKGPGEAKREDRIIANSSGRQDHQPRWFDMGPEKLLSVNRVQ